MGSVLVRMISAIRLFLSRSTAGSDSCPWVAAAMTAVAPASNSASAAPTVVLPVATMSSMIMQVRPATSPTTRLMATLCGTSGSRVLWMNASGQPPSRSVHRSASRTRPVSGETT